MSDPRAPKVTHATNGTLEDDWEPPRPALIDTLTRLCADPKNRVYIVSMTDWETFDEEYGMTRIPNLGICSGEGWVKLAGIEHGGRGVQPIKLGEGWRAGVEQLLLSDVNTRLEALVAQFNRTGDISKAGVVINPVQKETGEQTINVSACMKKDQMAAYLLNVHPEADFAMTDVGMLDVVHTALVTGYTPLLGSPHLRHLFTPQPIKFTSDTSFLVHVKETPKAKPLRLARYVVNGGYLSFGEALKALTIAWHLSPIP
ncbi:trehalose 6-P phosphatase, glycosyltransferase family 20 protein [Pseudohyphozyma bogoriensis]|nr:trehalose 6-P phosphatase, glycosyltransferase family 20 protein [Pseudohyphozyma bogoriensis]